MKINHKNTNNPFAQINTTNFYINQQDTIPKPLTKDTLEQIPSGINPLFLMIERKTQEVEAYKEQAALQRTKMVVRPIRPPRDTTCYFCPLGDAAPFHTLLTAKAQAPPSFVGEKLIDREIFRDLIQLRGEVFIVSDKSESSFTTSTIEIKKIEQETFPLDWVLFPLIGIFALLAFLNYFFTKQLLDSFRCFLFFHIANKINQDKSFVWTRFSHYLDLNLFLSAPLTLVLSFNFLGIDAHSSLTPQLFFLYALLGFLAYRVFRYITLNIIGFIANQSREINQLFTNQLLYTRIFGLALIPINVVLAYGISSIKFLVIYAATFILVMVLAFRLLRTLQVFLYNGFSMFYLFLYLCALEIIPILIIFNEIVRE